MTIQSHHRPDKTLETHLAEMGSVASVFFRRHSPTLEKMLAFQLAEAIAFHDTGKGTRFFQQYIADPDSYDGDPMLKAHTPVSLYYWLRYAFERDMAWLDILAVAALVWRHHGEFPVCSGHDGLEMAFGRCTESLPLQLADFPVEQISAITGRELSAETDWEWIDEKLVDFVYEHDFEDLGLNEAARFRLQVQIIFSMLLEADRAYLALSGPDLVAYLTDSPAELPGADRITAHCDAKPRTPLIERQTTLRRQVVEAATANMNTVTLPTGMGKTLIGAEWLLRKRSIDNVHRKMIVVLPFLSIIDQTVKEYKELLGPENADGILESHSLASRSYVTYEEGDSDQERAQAQNDARDFLADTWAAPLVITTFDQFLLALFSSENRHMLRCSSLADALVVMDEIQAVPPKLWTCMRLAFSQLAQHFNTRFLIMSATQPGFLPEAVEAVSHPTEVFSECRRYALHMRHQSPMEMDEFQEECTRRLTEEWADRRVLIVLNTRGAARHLRDAMADAAPKELPLFFLSADVIPRERLEYIEQIKQGNPCLVVSTQCVEAGVDIDMDFVIRDFAPLDSIVQVAGRCNRRGARKRAIVEIVDVHSPNGRSYANMVYDANILSETRSLLAGIDILPEENVLAYTRQYFERLRKIKDPGLDIAEDWAFWRDPLDVTAALGKGKKKHEFVVVQEATVDASGQGLKEAMEKAMETQDPWERKRRLRSLAGRIAEVSVSIWARCGFEPEDIADPLGCWWLLHEGYYQRGRGLLVERFTRRAASLCI